MIDVLLFAKAPRPGFVKTRLAASLGDAEALRLYRALGTRLVEQIHRVSHITVWYDPADALLEMREWLGGELTFRPQPPGDLGRRMQQGFATHFADAPQRPLIAVGVDAPGVDASTISTAAIALRSSPVVVGPAVDGGYYLLGMTAPQPTLLEGIPWSTDRVFEVTRERCRARGITPHILPPLRDVDTVDDARALGLIVLDPS